MKQTRVEKQTLVGLGILLFFGLSALLAPLLAPYSPKELFAPMLAPSAKHPLGTNDIGNDILCELLYGASFSLAISSIATISATALGLALGLIAGYWEKTGALLMRLVDIFLAMPRFPLIVLMAAFLKPGPLTLTAFFILFGWPQTARLVRSQILSERSREYVAAARLIGASDWHILWRHLLPSVIPLALVRFVLEFQHVLLSESSLSFLGLADPTVKSWGNMLHHAFSYPTLFISNVWVRWILPPGACIALVTTALSLLSTSLEVWANPRLRPPQHCCSPNPQKQPKKQKHKTWAFARHS